MILKSLQRQNLNLQKLNHSEFFMSNVDESQPLITHLVELRNRLLRCVICVVLVLFALVYFSMIFIILLLHL